VAKMATGGGAIYSITGRVTDGAGNPFLGVAISAATGGHTKTDANGNYTLSELAARQYTLTPSKSGYTFLPPSRTTSLPPDATGQDFSVATIEDQAVSLQYNGWCGVSDANASGSTYRVSKVKAATADFKFNGKSVTWITKKGPDQGKAKILIDGRRKGTFDLYSSTPQWKVPITVKGLTNQAHTLVVNVLGTKNLKSRDFNVSIDAFTVGAWTKQDDDPIGVKFSSWVGVTDTNSSGGSYRSRGKANAVAYLTFTGTSINWITALGPSNGIAQVTIDSKVVDTPDLYASTQHWQVAKTYGNLSIGQHTIQIKVLSAKNKLSKGGTVVVDAFSGPITTTGTSVLVEPEVEDSSSSDTSWLFWMLPLGIASLGIVRRRF
jgi:hypothetical protein